MITILHFCPACTSFPGVISQQGCDKQPPGAACKIIFLTGFVYGILVFYSFAANIISSLVYSRSIQSVSELLDYGQIRC